MRVLLTLLGIFIAISLAALACGDLDDAGGDDEGCHGLPIVIVSQ